MTSLIFHNPKCGTSRNTFAIMKASGENPEVIEYLKTPPSRNYLVELLAKINRWCSKKYAVIRRNHN